ncbi:oligopeptide/dipeptide ABC transporter, ATP-binding protein, C-terminal domain-containing protein [Jatrophihabitans endophyticus]|uniref:Oligopeptide/dipeptide ABC transporter, ATP-binding protein, C-terminal domain-containing protein n=1 Tax=Jatrophihabitans endophyticus TaxID=1206085 RepID=A0A1M5P690_9ACTN|nr:ABC transporter ATP-binding protein [Jatrophihabitans endophyticus]SHG96949.1 oligopeptide/dipeptide ABC transporter, ATP-binding protein, C-terminal domain-containing protein [Jatrophihabitans endophyticus]
MTAIDIADLAVVYPGRRGRPPARAVDGIDLRVGDGEIVALIGESGCGKSTLARAVVGLVRPTAGSIGCAGTPLPRRARELRSYRRLVQLVLQDPGGALNPRQTVYDAVAEGPRLHGLRDGLDERVHDALSRAGLRPPGSFVDRYPHELSGGQQQRVVIAGALALDPQVIVADEPVASLDASVRGEILALLLKLRDELGLSALVVSHDLGLAWNIADRVAVMYLGRIVEQGTVEDVLLRPRHPYTQALLSVVPDATREQLPSLIPGEPPDPTAIPVGCRFHPRCPRRRDLAADGVDVGVCETADPAVLAADGDGVACHFATERPKGEPVDAGAHLG